MSGVGSVSSSNATLSAYLAALANSASQNPGATSASTATASSSAAALASAAASSSEVEDGQLAALLSILKDGAGTASGAGSSSGNSAAAGNASSSSGSASDPSGNSASSSSGNSSSGGSGISLSDLRTQIESAVNAAIGNLDGSALSNPGAAAKAVRSAVDQTLQQDGLLTSAATPAPTSAGGAAQSQAAGGSGSSSAGASTSASSASSASAATAESSLLDNLLAQNNVDPTDFQNSLLSALSNLSTTGGADFSQLFQNFPGGLDIDAIA